MGTSAKVLILGGVLVGCNSTHGPGVPGPLTYFYANPVDGGTIFGVPAGSNQAVTLATGGNGHNIGASFAFDSDNLYFSDVQPLADAGLAVVGTLLTLPRAGGSARVIADGLDEVRAIALDGDLLYFIDDKFDADTFSPFIGSVPKAGGPVQHVADLPSGTGPVALAAAGGLVYWTQFDGQVLSAAGTGGVPVVLATGEKRPFSIVVGAGGVYWMNRGTIQTDCTPNDGEVREIVAGQGAPVTLASSLQGASALAVGGDQVFGSTVGAFCNVGGQGLGTVFELSPGRAAPRTVASGVTDPANLFPDSPTLHFTTVTDVESEALAPATAFY